MTTITLEHDPVGGDILLLGDVAGLMRHPLFSAYVRQCRGQVVSQNQLRIPTASEVLQSRYQALAKIFGRVGVEFSVGSQVSDELGRVEEEEERFTRFSEEAYEIWRANIDTEEFRRFVAVIEAQCPGRTFYRKQLLSAYHLAFAQNACNFSVPGAGKTSIVYAAYAFLRGLPAENEKSLNHLLIVGPLSSFKAWEDEYRSIFHGPPRVRRISGASSGTERGNYLRGIEFRSRDTEITLTSYSMLASSLEDFRALLKRSSRRVMMVLDEAHYIKRDDGVWSAAALSLAPLAAARVVLTGTPAPNGYEDLTNLDRKSVV